MNLTIQQTADFVEREALMHQAEDMLMEIPRWPKSLSLAYRSGSRMHCPMNSDSFI